MTSPFSQAAPALHDLGYHCLPLIPPSAPHGGRGKAPGDYRGGAWQGMSRWQRLRDSSASDFELKLWLNSPDANIGLVCGSPAGRAEDGTPLHVVAVDIDALDLDTVETLQGALPRSPMAKRGAKGITQFYRAAKTLKTRSYDGPDGRLLDLLTGFDARQTVCPPSIHPTTGKAYVWTAGPVRAEELPVLSADDLQVLEESLEQCGWSRTGTVRSQPPRPAPEDTDDIWSETKAAAMSRLADWVPALDLYGLRHARGGYEAVATWRPSCSGRAIAERKLNLSINPSGIKDWGTNDTYSAIDLVMSARDCDQAAATDWLRERLGLKDEGVVIELGCPRTADSSPKPLRIDPSLTVTDIEPLMRELDATPIQPVPDAPSTELPDHLTHVPGLLGELTDWICDSARRPQRGLALGAALTLIGTAAGRKYAGPTRTGTHLYVLGLARTSAGKDHALNAIARVLTACTMSAHIGPSQFMSMSALIKRLTRQPLTLSAIDEFGSFLARINGRKASTHERAITGVLRTAWGASFQTLSPPEWAGMVSEPIHSPALSIYGVSTHEEFFAALEGADVFNGFLNRFLAISTHERPAECEPVADAFTVPDSIVTRMISVFHAGGALAIASSHNERADAPMIVVPWADAAAKKVYRQFGLDVERRESDMAFLARTVETAQRLAVIRAIGRDPGSPSVSVADMEWGRDLALWSAERMMQDAAEHMHENQSQADAQRVLKIIRGKVRISHRDLLRALGSRIRSRDLADMLKQMQEAETVAIEKVTPERGGPPGVWYRALD